MNKIFSMDNKFFTFMGRIADLIILNIIFMICCIPIVTMGASITAMYYVTLKMARNEESYILKSFFKSFKENFRQSTIIWVIMLAAGLLLGIDFSITGQMGGTLYTILRYVLVMITFLYAMVILYLFPLLAKFYNTIKNTFRNSLLMSIRHLPYTVLMLVITFVPILSTLLIPVVLIYGLIVWIMIGFSLIAFINAKFFVKIFDHYIPEE